MRRHAFESLLVASAVALLVAAWFHPPSGQVCGEGGPWTALRIATLREGEPGGGGGWPTLGLATGLAYGVGEARAWLLVLALGVGTGAGTLWGLARRAGAEVPGALLAVLLGTLPPALASGVAQGSAELAAVPFIAVALGATGRFAAVFRVLAVLLAGAFDARLGAVTGLASALAGGGWPALMAALLSAGGGVVGDQAAAVDPVDLGAPLLPLREGAVAPGLAVLAATLWAAPDRGLRRGAALGLVMALGPVLQAFGEPLLVGRAAIPLPGALLAAFAPHGGWGAPLLVAAVAAALGVARIARPRLAWLLAPLALLEGATTLGTRPTCFALEAPVAVRYLSEREGGVLDLPVAVRNGDRVLGDPAAHTLYAWYRFTHRRPLAVGRGAIGPAHALMGEPAVVLAVDVAAGGRRFLLPPTRPGEVLRGLGVTEIVLHRAFLSAEALALLDPVMLKLYGPPQRDHAGQVDTWRISAEGSARPPSAETLHAADGPAPRGWLELGAYIAGLTPVAPGETAAPVTPATPTPPRGEPKGERPDRPRRPPRTTPQ